jgi:DeoR/GlpR family transcriptional regulator of sugar metabolism
LSITKIITKFKFLPILNALLQDKDIHVISLSGEYLSRFDASTGWLRETSLATWHANLQFTLTTAVSKGGTYHPNNGL